MKRSLVNSLFTIVLVFTGGVVFAQIDTNARDIPWAPIKDENILWTKRVWREIAVYERQNVALTNAPQTPQENVFANILLSGINSGQFQTYADDLLGGIGQKEEKLRDYWIYGDTLVNKGTAKPLILKHLVTKEEINKIIACDPTNLSANTRGYLNHSAQHKNDSLLFPAEGAETKRTKKKKKQQETEPEQAVLIYDTTAVSSCSYPQQVSHYAIVEDWTFDRDRGEMVVRIAAIAPLVNGKALFWLAYPEIRRYIAGFEVYNGKVKAGYNYDEYFESRKFASKITRLGRTFSSPEQKK